MITKKTLSRVGLATVATTALVASAAPSAQAWTVGPCSGGSALVVCEVAGYGVVCAKIDKPWACTAYGPPRR